MTIKTLNKKQLAALEKAAHNGVYVSPTNISPKQDLQTKKIIEKLKDSNLKISQRN